MQVTAARAAPPSRQPVAPAQAAQTARASQAAAPARDRFDAGSASPRYEISRDRKLSKPELDQISRSDPALARSIGEAQKTYAGLLDQGAKLVVTTSAGNGGKPVLAIVPPSMAGNADPSKPYQVQVHYHGMMGRASQPNASSPLLQRISDSFNRQPPTVFVLPEWKGDNDWSNVKNTGTTASDALKGVVGQRGPVTVSAHSLGRKAVESAIRNNGLKADRLDMQDAFYKTQPEGPRLVAQWMKANPEAKVRILLTTSGAMSDQKTIQSQAPFPDSVFDDQSRRQNHWDAELKPW